MSAQMIQILKPDGTLNEDHPVPEISPDELVRMYRIMLLNRRVDEQMTRLQRQGRIGFYIGSVGEEASIVGSAAAMDDSEWIVPCYRELGAGLWRGMRLFDFFCQLFGNARDLIKGRQMPNHWARPELHLSSISSPVGTQIPQAAGMALASRISGRSESVLVYFGDGATSQGDFHVGANFAGVFKAPLVMLCRNNQWAISVPFSTQTASDGIAVKAQAYGMEGIQVDGNDVLGVLSVTRHAAEKARTGEGPALIEAVTYRLTGHSTSDDPRAYRDSDEVERARAHDPLIRFRTYLTACELWSDDHEEALEAEVKATIQENLKKAESVEKPTTESMFEDVYHTMPWHLREQMEELEILLEDQVIEQEV